MTWEWPQIALACLCGCNLLQKAFADGKPRTDKHSLGFFLLDGALLFTLLWFGGFWHGGAR